MATWRANWEWTAASNIPADKVVNTFHFEGAESATNTANMRDLLVDFYSDTYLGGTIRGLMPDSAVTGDWTLNIYCLADPEPRQPRASYEGTMAVSTSDGLPSEVALCLSYHGAPVSGESQARRRGRIYLGPFTEAMNSAEGRPGSGQMDTILGAAAELLAASQASTTWEWVVYSRVADATTPVVGGWVDDAWDTQRRRGVARTERRLFT